MSNYTITLTHSTKTPTQIKKFFGAKNVSRIQTNKSSSKLETMTSFIKTFSPSVSEYTDRSLLVVPIRSLSLVKLHKVLELENLSQPLYWNEKLGGWITSKKNYSHFKKCMPSLKEKLTNFMSHYSVKVSEYSPRAYLLVPMDKLTFAKKQKIVNINGLMKKPFYWNDSLGGWITSKKNKVFLKSWLEDADTNTSPSIQEDEDDEVPVSLSSNDISELNDFIFAKYKNGLLLKTNDTSKHGTKYFHNGYWNEALEGWVYSKSEFDNLQSLGAHSVLCINQDVNY